MFETQEGTLNHDLRFLNPAASTPTVPGFFVSLRCWTSLLPSAEKVESSTRILGW